jgi:hypothetical protein
MRLLKRTYALPPETVERFEEAVASGRRSAVIADLIHDWLEARRREELRREIIEGCREMAAVYQEIERDYQPLDEELHRAVEP